MDYTVLPKSAKICKNPYQRVIRYFNKHWWIHIPWNGQIHYRTSASQIPFHYCTESTGLTGLFAGPSTHRIQLPAENVWDFCSPRTNISTTFPNINIICRKSRGVFTTRSDQTSTTSEQDPCTPSRTSPWHHSHRRMLDQWPRTGTRYCRHIRNNILWWVCKNSQ